MFDTPTLLLTFIGAFAGAVFAPFGEYLFERLLGRETNKIASGFILLCIANAFWVIISFLFSINNNSENIFWVIAITYFVSVMIFITSFRSFIKSELRDINPRYFSALAWLLLGNMLWVLSEFVAPLFIYNDWSEETYLVVSSILLLISALLFFVGAFSLRGEIIHNSEPEEQ